MEIVLNYEHNLIQIFLKNIYMFKLSPGSNMYNLKTKHSSWKWPFFGQYKSNEEKQNKSIL